MSTWRRDDARIATPTIVASIPEPFMLMLDDLHEVTAPERHEIPDYLLERLPPHMHLAIATRYAPSRRRQLCTRRR